MLQAMFVLSIKLRRHEHGFMHFSFLLGDHTSRPLSCCLWGRGYKNGKRRAGIGVATERQEVTRPSLPMLLSDSVAIHRWFEDISTRPVWLAIKDVDVTSNYTYY